MEVQNVSTSIRFFNETVSASICHFSRVFRHVVLLSDSFDDVPETQCAPYLRPELVGDVHGQLFDVSRMFSEFGLPSKKTHYLMMGDYPDRGGASVEVVMLVFAMKVAFPDVYALLRVYLQKYVFSPPAPF